MLSRTKYTEKWYKKYLSQYRKKYIPTEFNQIRLCDELLNDEIDHYISISNRSDGKTFNYISFLFSLCMEVDGLGFFLLCRNYSVRQSYLETLTQILEMVPLFDPQLINYVSRQYYIELFYDGKCIGLISDLNAATNLKYSSNFLAKFPIIIYDEFLAIEGDYLPDEWERLKTIYASVNRRFDIPLIKFPKILYLGNAVNFSSPILSKLNLFNTLERHPIGEARQYKNIYLEMQKNENINKMRNLRAFSEEEDAMTFGEFDINDHNLATEAERDLCISTNAPIFVKFRQGFLRIDYNREHKITILSILGFIEVPYDYNTELKDNTDTSKYLIDNYYSPSELRKHNKGLYKYDNNYSKDTILTDAQLSMLKIDRLIGEQAKNARPENVTTIHDYDRIYLERSKRSLLERFFK